MKVAEWTRAPAWLAGPYKLRYGSVGDLMDFEAFSPDRKLTLCLKAEEVCLRRIRDIKRMADPGDPALHHLLREIESGELAQLSQVAKLGKPTGLHDVEVESYFPSTRERLGEAPLSRDSAMYYVERLKEEASHFFQKMAQVAADDRARAILTQIALGELGQVAQLRTVLL